MKLASQNFMSTATNALAGKTAERIRFYDSTLGKKAVMAVTGVVLFGFVIVHMLGNLQVYLGPEKLDAYGALLKANAGVLWGARLFLLLATALHIWSAVQLAALKNKARPVAYSKLQPTRSSYASRTMYWSGPILSAFIVYHLLHFTTGNAHPNFEEGRVYHNVVTGFRNVPASLAYIVAMLLLGTHLYHGAWSMFQTLGVNHPRYTPLLKRFAAAAAAALVIGNISIPLSVLAGLVK